MTNSRRKGAEGERELAGKLRDYGFQARRGQQFSGANGDPDVLGLPNIHIECKRVEKLNLEDAMDQAKRDARKGELPAVFHRKNNHKWLVTMELDSWMQIYKESEYSEVEVHLNDHIVGPIFNVEEEEDEDKAD